MSALAAATPAGDPEWALLTELVAIASPSGGEHRLADHLCRRLRELGFRARRDRVGNVVGLAGSRDPASPRIMLLGHMDTVGGAVPVRAEADRLYGRGAVDAKGSLAAMVWAAQRLAGAAFRVEVVGVVEEETPASRGAAEVARGEPPDAVVVGEPSGWSSVVLGYKGKLDLRYRVSRPASHSSSPDEKATSAVVGFWTALLDALGPQGTAFDLPSAALCELSGDLVEASADISCRLPPGFAAGAFLGRLRQEARGGSVVVRNVVDAVRVPRSDPVVTALSAGIRRHGGRPVHRLRAGTSDMNTLRTRWDVPMATYGPGDSRLDHSDEEHIVRDDYLRAIDVLATATGTLGRTLAATGGWSGAQRVRSRR